MQLTDDQIAIVQSRLRLDSICMELQSDLLDHFCCFIEQELERDVPFEQAYRNAVAAIAPNGVEEIEDELFFLLTFKNQTNMKRIVLGSGVFAVSVLCLGLLLKFAHMPGAGVCIVSGITLFSLFFMPALFVLQSRGEQQITKKLLRAAGMLSGILMSISIMFLVMHWPGAMVLGYLSVGVLLLAFLPLYFVVARGSEGKSSIAITSLLVMAGCGLWLTLVASPRSVKMNNEKITRDYLRAERILQSEEQQLGGIAHISTTEGQAIYKTCAGLKGYLLSRETGNDHLTYELADKGVVIKNAWVDRYFSDNPAQMHQLIALKQQVAKYNQLHAAGRSRRVPADISILQGAGERVTDVLHELTDIQMIVLQNEQLGLVAR